jgi:hypothetical protein
VNDKNGVIIRFNLSAIKITDKKARLITRLAPLHAFDASPSINIVLRFPAINELDKQKLFCYCSQRSFRLANYKD